MIGFLTSPVNTPIILWFSGRHNQMHLVRTVKRIVVVKRVLEQLSFEQKNQFVSNGKRHKFFNKSHDFQRKLDDFACEIHYF
jgi:hypothetical protein